VALSIGLSWPVAMLLEGLNKRANLVDLERESCGLSSRACRMLRTPDFRPDTPGECYHSHGISADPNTENRGNAEEDIL
jgi:hypothetical protein